MKLARAVGNIGEVRVRLFAIYLSDVTRRILADTRDPERDSTLHNCVSVTPAVLERRKGFS